MRIVSVPLGQMMQLASLQQLWSDNVSHEHIHVDHTQLLPDGVCVNATLVLLLDHNNRLEGILVQRNLECAA